MIRRKIILDTMFYFSIQSYILYKPTNLQSKFLFCFNCQEIADSEVSSILALCPHNNHYLFLSEPR